jgi:hypothetical protein
MPCHAMHPIQDLFWESFSYELQFDMHSYLHKNFILAKSGCYNTEFTLLRVQLHFEFSQVIEGLCQVRDEFLIFPSFYDHVVNVCFGVAPKL